MNKTFHANNIHYNACVGYNGNYDIETYALGYAQSAHILLKSAINGDTSIDTIIYPILYSSRHYIELTLKYQLSLLGIINQIVDSNFNFQIRQIHSISELWNRFKDMASVDSRYNYYINKAEEYIDDFAEIDDNGETFRYPYSKDNNKHLTQLYCIDIMDFGVRFEELNNILEEIVWLTNSLLEEYSQRSIVSNKSRSEIEEIANKLPPVNDWHNNSFKKLKEKLKYEYSLSSNQLSRIISFIKSHREFSSLIGKEIKIDELDVKDLAWFIKTYDEFLENKSDCEDYKEFLHKTIRKIYRKLSKIKVASIAQLYDMGYFRLYSEEYDRGLKEKMKEDKVILIRVYLLGNIIVKDKIKLGLESMGQKTLLQLFE